MHQTNSRVYFLDIVKALAMLGVVIIHVNAQLIFDISKQHISYGQHALTVLCLLSYLARFCVPLFIMATGYLFWNNIITVSFKKTLTRIVAARFAWPGSTRNR